MGVMSTYFREKYALNFAPVPSSEKKLYTYGKSLYTIYTKVPHIFKN